VALCDVLDRLQSPAAYNHDPRSLLSSERPSRTMTIDTVGGAICESTCVLLSVPLRVTGCALSRNVFACACVDCLTPSDLMLCVCLLCRSMWC
jgi:hypothetical protein